MEVLMKLKKGCSGIHRNAGWMRGGKEESDAWVSDFGGGIF
jgi:hypothetical protein